MVGVQPTEPSDIGTGSFSRTKPVDGAARLLRMHDAKSRTMGVRQQRPPPEAAC